MRNSFSLQFIAKSIVLLVFALAASASSFAQTVVYDITATELIDWNTSGPGCVTMDDKYTCGDTVSIVWTSTGSGSVSSASIEFYQTWLDAGSITTMLNGVADSNYTSTPGTCSSIEYTLNLGASAYNVGGVNTFKIIPDMACLVIDQNAAWSNAYARVTVTYGAVSGPPTWNGTANWTDHPNWTNGTPVAADSVVVQSGTLTVDTDVTVTDLTLENGATFIIEPGNTLTVTGEYINNGGTFTVQTGGEIAFQGVMKKNGTIRARNFGSLKVKSGSVGLGN